jgi:hypothetical protein
MADPTGYGKGNLFCLEVERLSFQPLAFPVGRQASSMNELAPSAPFMTCSHYCLLVSSRLASPNGDYIERPISAIP